MRTYLSGVIFITVLLIGFHVGAGARGGGGSRGGGARSSSGSSSRSSSRSSSGSTSRSTVRFGTRSSYRGPTYSSGSWKTAAALGTLYGVTSYQRRRLYHSHPDREPTICFNQDDLRNGTYGFFICPEEGQDDDYDSCCGDEDSQYCCSFLLTPGAIVGIVIAVIIVCGAIGLVVFCVIKRRQRIQKTVQRPQASSCAVFSKPDNGKTFATTYDSNPVGPPAYSYPQPVDQAGATPVYPGADQGYPLAYPPPGQLPPSSDTKAPPTDDYGYTNIYPTEPGAPPYPSNGFSQPSGPYSTPMVNPPAYSEKQ